MPMGFARCTNQPGDQNREERLGREEKRRSIRAPNRRLALAHSSLAGPCFQKGRYRRYVGGRAVRCLREKCRSHCSKSAKGESIVTEAFSLHVTTDAKTCQRCRKPAVARRNVSGPDNHKAALGRITGILPQSTKRAATHTSHTNAVV